MKKCRISITFGQHPASFADFEDWINEKLDKHQVNYKVNEEIIRDAIGSFIFEWDNNENREKILTLILEDPKTKTLKDIRKEKLEKINNN